VESGKLIVIEGPEGSGKSTQASMLHKALCSAGIPTLLTHEPGDTSEGNHIRRILLEGTEDLSAMTELLLFEAARSAWIGKIVKPAITRGEVVIADRSYISTLAYQGYAGGIPIETVAYVNNLAMQGVSPSVVVILDIDLDTVFKRISTRGGGKDRIESRIQQYHQKVIEGYRQIAASSDDIILVDGSGSELEVHSSIVSIINRELDLGLQTCL